MRALSAAGGTASPEALGRAYAVLRPGWARHRPQGERWAVASRQPTDGSNTLSNPRRCVESELLARWHELSEGLLGRPTLWEPVAWCGGIELASGRLGSRRARW